ncbi:MAG: hypothetical protein V1816_18820 [Pseudomonadota bacterium]
MGIWEIIRFVESPIHLIALFVILIFLIIIKILSEKTKIIQSAPDNERANVIAQYLIIKKKIDATSLSDNQKFELWRKMILNTKILIFIGFAVIIFVLSVLFFIFFESNKSNVPELKMSIGRLLNTKILNENYFKKGDEVWFDISCTASKGEISKIEIKYDKYADWELINISGNNKTNQKSTFKRSFDIGQHQIFCRCTTVTLNKIEVSSTIWLQ